MSQRTRLPKGAVRLFVTSESAGVLFLKQCIQTEDHLRSITCRYMEKKDEKGGKRLPSALRIDDIVIDSRCDQK